MSAASGLTADRGRPASRPRRAPGSRPHRARLGRPWASSMAPLVAAEAFSGAVGFGVMMLLARRLGSGGFADFEYASAVAAWALVLVRGGFDTIAYREAGRRPGLIRPWTDLLLGLRLASAAVALLAVVALAALAGPGRGAVVVASGLILIPSALAADLGLRASGRFGPLALAQAIRSLGLALGVAGLVSGPGRALAAAGCVAGAEVASSLVLLGFHASGHGLPRPRFRRRAWSIVATRGAIAGLTRFGRVSLYAADLMALGWLADGGLGPYAAARRLVFALLALGLVVPSALGPRLARAWAAGPLEAREVLGRASLGLAVLTWPAAAGLIATADRWMPRLFGDDFRAGAPWLALIAARLPLLLASNLQHAALVAARREGWSLRLIAAMVASAVVLLPLLAMAFGPTGVALAMLGVEGAGAIAGRVSLGRLGLAPTGDRGWVAVLAGCFGLILICRFGKGMPLEAVVGASVAVYAATWRGAGLLLGATPAKGAA